MRQLAIALVGVLIAAGSAAAESPVTAAPDPVVPKKAPDFSEFVAVGKLAGEVVAVGDDGFKLRVSWTEPAQVAVRKWVAPTYRPNNGGKPIRTGTVGSTSIRRRPAREKHRDIEVRFADAGLVRREHLPTKPGSNGKRMAYAPAERQKLETVGVPGWAASRDDLQPGRDVVVDFVRPKAMKPSEVTLSDLEAKYVRITPPRH